MLFILRFSGRILYRPRSHPLTEAAENSRDRFSRIRNCRRPASSLPAEKEFRAFERLRQNRSCSVLRPDEGIKSREERPIPLGGRARGKEDAPLASRSRVHEILPSSQLLLAALAVVARFCSDRISKGNYVSIASIVVNRGARPNMGLLATTITIATSAACTTIEAVRRGTTTGVRTARKRLCGGRDARGAKSTVNYYCP